MITRHNPTKFSLSFFQRRKTTGWLSQVFPGCYGLSRDKHQVGLSRDNPGYPGITLFWDKSAYPGITQHIPCYTVISQDNPVADGARPVLAPQRLRRLPSRLPPCLQQH